MPKDIFEKALVSSFVRTPGATENCVWLTLDVTAAPDEEMADRADSESVVAFKVTCNRPEDRKIQRSSNTSRRPTLIEVARWSAIVRAVEDEDHVILQGCNSPESFVSVDLISFAENIQATLCQTRRWSKAKVVALPTMRRVEPSGSVTLSVADTMPDVIISGRATAPPRVAAVAVRATDRSDEQKLLERLASAGHFSGNAVNAFQQQDHFNSR